MNMTQCNEFEEIYKENKGLIHHTIKKFREGLDNFNIEYDDAIGVCNIAFYKGYLSYDKSKGYKLTTHLVNCMEHTLINLIKSHKALKRIHPSLIDSGDEIRYSPKEEESTIFSTLKGDVNIEDEIMMQYAEELIINKLSKGHNKKKLEIYFLRRRGYSQKEVCKVFGVSNAYVSRLDVEIKAIIKNALGEK
jgi:RNA polymerase sigma factor (sigma-70 family)